MFGFDVGLADDVPLVLADAFGSLDDVGRDVGPLLGVNTG